jgi:hypothetical protein
MSIIPATREAKVGGSLLEASPGKVSAKPYLTKKLETKGIGMWFK